MGIFYRSSVFESDVPVDLPEVDGPVSAEDIENQVEEDKLDIVEAIHDNDMEEIQHDKEVQDAVEAGADEEEVKAMEESWSIVRENAVKDFFDKLLEKLKALWAKIKEFFKSIFVYLQAMFMSAKEFANKYEKELTALERDGKLKNYEYVGFKYQTEKLIANIKNTVDSYNRIGDFNVDKFDDTTESDRMKKLGNLHRKSVLAASEPVDAEDFSEKLYTYARVDAANSKDTTNIPFRVKEVIATIRKRDKDMDDIKSYERKLDGIFNDTKKAIEKTKQEKLDLNVEKTDDDENLKNSKATKRENATKRAAFLVTKINQLSSIVSTATGTVKSALTEEMNTLKRACAGAFTYARKQK